jgi:predicted nucleic acid-binding Zn ribbon protein
MKKSNEQSIGEAIREMMKHYKLDDKYEAVRIAGLWPDLVGPMISRHTEKVFIKDGKLFIKVDSPALKNELLYMTSGIKDLVNDKAGREIVKEVVLL